jgi:hypothetical protein
MAPSSIPPSRKNVNLVDHRSSQGDGNAFNSRSVETDLNMPVFHRFPGLGRIVAFFVVVVVMAYGLDAIITYGLKQIPTSKFGSFNKVVSGHVNAEIIINGSSRALTHYDPRIIERLTGHSAYNLGMNGTQTDVHAAVLKTYLSRNSKPKIVIQNLESFTFEPTLPGELYDPGTYVPYLNEEPLYRSLLAIDKNVWKWKHIPLYGYAVEDMKFTWAWGILGCLGFYGQENYFQGFTPRHTPWTGEFERFKAGLSAKGVRNRIDPRGMHALREIIQICKEADIHLILVYSPVYSEMQLLEINRPEIFALFRELSLEYQVPFWDYSDHTICREQTNFYNSQHLNANGAALFTADLTRRIVETFGPKKQEVR